ncbi:hypothetical protein UFOVP733_25 [uncultured Caudovirales phage]|uniref:Uncharacterized protein n=1 Tax=uncultured Caudovirales phage TaxID=2100421 RepID=A0A6J7X5G0_9CAUD|nr:hypothetical protein UFOVP733_25 [uncultured Caudovirales phage]CAB5224913.1 hypothetical protein UFOVP743_34 [uncultured Caudovirales phage]
MNQNIDENIQKELDEQSIKIFKDFFDIKKDIFLRRLIY